MSINAPNFPASVWNGSTPVRSSDRQIDRVPDFEDWDQMVAEVIAMQTEARKQKYINLANGSGGAIIAGAPVYELANGTGFGKADCNGATVLSQVVGLTSIATASLATTDVCKRGPHTLTTAQWDAVAGTTGGLAAGVEYYLSGTAERITATRPATTGDHIISLGIALSSTVLDIDIKYRGVSA